MASEGDNFERALPGFWEPFINNVLNPVAVKGRGVVPRASSLEEVVSKIGVAGFVINTKLWDTDREGAIAFRAAETLRRGGGTGSSSLTLSSEAGGDVTVVHKSVSQAETVPGNSGVQRDGIRQLFCFCFRRLLTLVSLLSLCFTSRLLTLVSLLSLLLFSFSFSPFLSRITRLT